MLESPSLSVLLIASAAVAFGALVQGTIGFGLAVVSVPVIAIVMPEAVPTTLLLLALPTTAWMALHERADLDARGFAWIVVGRIPGTVAGALVLALVPAAEQGALFGAAVVIAAVASAVSPPFDPTPGRSMVAGFVSGTMGTSSALGGPALALLYQRRPGPQLRATLALSFFVGILFSLVGVAFAGRASWDHVVLALKLMPALVLGLLASRPARRLLDRGWLRQAVLTFAAAAGTLAFLRAVLS